MSGASANTVHQSPGVPVAVPGWLTGSRSPNRALYILSTIGAVASARGTWRSLGIGGAFVLWGSGCCGADELRHLGRVKILVQPGDEAAFDGADDTGAQAHGHTVGPHAGQFVLLHEPAGEHLEPAVAIDAVRNALDEALQRRGVVVPGLHGVVGVVPDLRVRRVAVVERVDVAVLHRVEEAFGQRVGIFFFFQAEDGIRGTSVTRRVLFR